MKKSLLFLMAIIIISVTGCGETQETFNGQNGKSLNKDNIHIAYVAMSTSSPHGLINEKYNIFADELAKSGIKVKLTTTRSLDNVYPMMDNENSPDFVYLPHSAFTTYVTKTSKFGGSDKYAIVAGSLDLSDVELVTRPEIKSLKDLDGKKVGISNLRYTDEFQLNKLLATVGLKTKSMGGTVEVIWDDIVSMTSQNYEKGLYDAVVVFNTDNRSLALKKVPGSNYQKLFPGDLYDGLHPRIWMVAKKELIKSYPELVKEVLKAHILSDDKAKAERDELPALNRKVYLDYFKEKGADLSDKHPIEKYEERWKLPRITYDPNVEFITGLFEYLDKNGLAEEMSLTDFVQSTPLNEVLEDMGRLEVKE